MKWPFTRARIYANAAKHYLLEEYRTWDVSPVPAEFLDEVLSNYADDVVFVHAGLSDVKAAFGGNPYELLFGKLSDHFESILAPGFTPSFRRSGIYHKIYSRPEWGGTFSRLFLQDSDYRTNDAVHSILVKGDYRFENCNHQDSFGSDGCWGKLDEEDVLIANIGTDWLLSTQHHYIERYYDVPYNAPKDHEGHIYYGEETHERITQTNYTYDFRALRRNHLKIQRMMAEKGLLDVYDLGGLQVLFFRARDLRLALGEELVDDPYYMVAW